MTDTSTSIPASDATTVESAAVVTTDDLPITSHEVPLSTRSWRQVRIAAPVGFYLITEGEIPIDGTEDCTLCLSIHAAGEPPKALPGKSSLRMDEGELYFLVKK